MPAPRRRRPLPDAEPRAAGRRPTSRRRPDPAVRRRRRTLAAAAAVALVGGVFVGARDDGGPADRRPSAPGRAPAPAEAPARDLTLAQQAGQVVVLRFPGPRPPRHVRRALARGEAAGAILFADNVPTPARARALTRALQRAAGGSALVCADQEGGPVRVLGWAPPRLPQPAQATAATVAAEAAAAGAALRAAGVNVALAPVADVHRPGGALAGRAYPGDAGQVAALTSASVRALSDARVAPVVKHFPGLGRAGANTDDAAVTIAAGAADLKADLEPFAAAVRAGTPAVMVGHARYPAFDRGRIASQSPRVLQGVLRDRLRFRGVAVTDSLEAQAVARESSLGTAAERSLRAGADLLLLTGEASRAIVHRRLVAAARRSPAFARRLKSAAARVLALKRWLGLPPPPAAP